MAIDASLTGIFGLHVACVVALLLIVSAHGLEVMAIATLARIRVFHTLPLMGRQSDALGLKFFRRVDAARQFAPNLKARLGLSQHLVTPVFGHVTIRANGPDTTSVAVVNRGLVLLIHRVSHFMT